MRYDMDENEQAVIDAMRRNKEAALIQGRREGLNSVAAIMVWVHAEPLNTELLRRSILNQFEKAAQDMGLPPDAGVFRDVAFYRDLAKPSQGN